jgi:hypothetical protein
MVGRGVRALASFFSLSNMRARESAREKEISAMSGMRSCYDFSLCLADAAIYTQLSVEKTLMLNIFLNLIRHPSQQQAEHA